MKKVGKVLFVMTALMALSACSGGTTVVDRALPTDDPTSETEIIFWHCLGHAKTTELEKVRDAFNIEYAGKYKVNLVHLAGDYDTLHDALKTKLASGEIPALSMGYPDSFAEYISKDITESSLLRITNFIEDENYGYSASEIADFVPGYYNEGTGYQFEGTWSMPMYKSTEVMYYNKSYFNGLNEQNKQKFENDTQFNTLLAKVNGQTSASSPTFNDDLAALRTYVSGKGGYVYDVPTKWNDMFTLARQINADRAAQNVKTEFYPVGYDSDANMFISQFAQRDIPYTVNNEESKADPNKHFVFDNQGAKDFLNEVLGYINEGSMVTKGSLGGDKYTNDYFTNGKLVMSIGSTGGSSYQVSSNFEVGLAPVPYYGNTPKYIQQGPSICFFDNDDDYIHKGAWLFYKMMADTTYNANLALENSYDPIRISSYQTESYQNWLAMAGKGALKYDIPAITATLKDYYFTSPTFVGSGTARTQIGSLIKYTKLQGYSVDEAFQLAMNQCKQAA